jgi:adenine deaminase
LNAAVAEATRLGLPALVAIRLATLNAARRLRVAPWLGCIRQGALADIQLQHSLCEKPHIVLVGGRRPFGRTPPPVPLSLLESIQLGNISEEEFQHPGPGEWRTILVEKDAPLITREVKSDGSDAAPVIAIDSADDQRTFRGLLQGYSVQDGAVACTTVTDAHCVLVTGSDPSDMARAVARVTQMNGGAAVFSRGRLLASWRAAIAGLLSFGSADDVVTEVAAVNGAVRGLGNTFANPLLTLEFLTSPAVPHLRISPAGYVRIRDGARLGLQWRDS